jgi:hypothetical protein
MPGEASSIFGAVLVSYGVNGTPPPGSGGVPSPEHNLTAVPALLNYMEEFVLVHELAHLVNRDAERLETKTVSPWDAEYQADQWAASVVTALAYRSTGAFALAFIACDLALTAQHFLDLTLSTLQYGAKPFSWISPTHPDALSRRKRLRLSMGDMLPPDAPASAPAAQTLVRMTDALLMQLWQLTSPEVILAFQSGQRPASVWRDHVRASIQVTGDRPIQ